MKPSRLALAVATALLAGVALAQDQVRPPAAPEEGNPPGPRREGERPPGRGMEGPPRDMPKFSDFDADKNGEVTEEEFVNFHVKRAQERSKEGFAQMDVNKDGKITEAEIPKPRGDGGRPGPRGPEGEGPKRPAPEEGAAPKRPPLDGGEAKN